MAVNKNGDWLNNIQEQTRVLFEEAYHLKHLASSFYTVGNSKISKELETISENILTAQKEIGGNIFKMLSDEVNAGNREIGNVLKAVLSKVK